MPAPKPKSSVDLKFSRETSSLPCLHTINTPVSLPLKSACVTQSPAQVAALHFLLALLKLIFYLHYKN